MFKRVSMLMLIICMGSAQGAGTFSKNKKYEVTIQNLTVGQPLTPAVIAIHSSDIHILQIGESASIGLGELAGLSTYGLFEAIKWFTLITNL